MNTPERTVRRSLREYARGAAGGLMFSVPLLYTQEVWDAGFVVHPARLVVYMLATFGLLLGYNRYAGLRHDATRLDVAIDSIEEMGLGFIIATLVLLTLGRIAPEMPLSEVAGKIAIEAMIVAIGVSVGTAQLGDTNQGSDGGAGGESTPATDQGSAGSEQKASQFSGQLVIAFCGAVLFAANIAPTEEVRVLAAEISSWNLLALGCLSVAICALILYHTEFRSASRYVQAEGAFAVLTGTVVAYAVALVSSGLMLWLYGGFEGLEPITGLAQIVVLAFPAALGASAGRLLLQ